MKNLTILLAFLGGLALFGFTGCEEQGPFEEAGESMDEAAEEVGDEIDDAT